MAGRSGRPSVPSNVHQLRGNPSKKPLAELLGEFQPDVELPDCPDHLRDEAAREYLRLGEELWRYNLVSSIDRGVLAMIATVWARYVWAEEKIREYNDKDPQGERGLVDRTPNAYKVMSVYLQISNAAMTQYLKLAAEFGLSPASRSKVKPGESSQGVLPGFETTEESTGPSIRHFGSFAA